jgi:hypothetical protein
MSHDFTSRSLEILLVALLVGCQVWLTITAFSWTPSGS